MVEPIMGEIRMFSFAFAPKNWNRCDGQEMDVNKNPALYSLLGNTFGGNERSFNLPDFRGRIPIHPDRNLGYCYDMGMSGGFEEVALDATQMPKHKHTFYASSEDAGSSSIIDNDKCMLATTVSLNDATPMPIYGPAKELVSMNGAACSSIGDGLAHSNIMPSTVINFCIAMDGFYPSRN